MEYKGEFEFYPGEYLAGDMTISPNTDISFLSKAENVA